MKYIACFNDLYNNNKYFPDLFGNAIEEIGDMMTIEQLQEKYPKHKVISSPLSSCSVCCGRGEFQNARGNNHICMCTCISGNKKIRRIMVDMFQNFTECLLEKELERRKEMPNPVKGLKMTLFPMKKALRRKDHDSSS